MRADKHSLGGRVSLVGGTRESRRPKELWVYRNCEGREDTSPNPGHEYGGCLSKQKRHGM